MSAPAPKPPPKSWPMKWIVVAIVAFIVPYTVITLRFRKPGRAYEPYADTRDRVTSARLTDAGFTEVPLTLTLPPAADTAASSSATPVAPANVTLAAGGLPEELAACFAEPPRLPENVTDVSASSEPGAATAFAIEFRCALPEGPSLPISALACQRDGVVTVVVNLERLDPELLARSTPRIVRLEFPPEALAPGRHEIMLAGARESARWSVVVH